MPSQQATKRLVHTPHSPISVIGDILNSLFVGTKGHIRWSEVSLTLGSVKAKVHWAYTFSKSPLSDALDEKASLKVAGVVGEIINVGTIHCDSQVQFNLCNLWRLSS